MILNLTNGENVELEITFRKLAELRKQNIKTYKEYNRVIMEGAKEIFDYAAVVYAAYCCNKKEEAVGYEEFLEVIPMDVNVLIAAFNSIVTKEKKQDLPTSSENARAN